MSTDNNKKAGKTKKGIRGEKREERRKERRKEGRESWSVGIPFVRSFYRK